MSYHKLTYYGSVENGTLKLSERKRFDNDLKLFEGQRVEVTVAKKKKIRSNDQNAMLWGLIYPHAIQGFLDAGWEGVSEEEIHGFFKRRFLDNGNERADPETGEVIKNDNTTRTLSTTEFNAFVEQIARFCAEYLNIVIPEPNTQLT